MIKMLLNHGAQFRLSECISIREEFDKEKIGTVNRLKTVEI